MDSTELTHWMVLFQVQAEDADHARDVADSGDGIVHVSGRAIDDAIDDEGDDG